MAAITGKWGKLTCNKCNLEFELSREFHSNTAIRCPHCGKSSQYRTEDYTRQNFRKKNSS
jgi:hypothetical protein